MNISTIREILNAHKEHYRVLPDKVSSALLGVIEAIDHDLAVSAAIPKAPPLIPTKPAKKVPKKAAKKKR